ncbi:unnamed protein product [Rangifer tarandus platyrhynchus]|uniref:Uncharacterized protein n=1 Tax=Rangifer tarandus platyrhynchus TaxID=3082113 RepID=A0AC59YLH3_RANTA
MLVGDAERFSCALEQPRTKVTARGSEFGSRAVKPANHSVRPPVPTCRRAERSLHRHAVLCVDPCAEAAPHLLVPACAHFTQNGSVCEKAEEPAELFLCRPPPCLSRILGLHGPRGGFGVRQPCSVEPRSVGVRDSVCGGLWTWPADWSSSPGWQPRGLQRCPPPHPHTGQT